MKEYEQFVKDIWRDGGTDGQLDLRGLFICCTGLPGEAAEASEAITDLLVDLVALQTCIGRALEPIKKNVRNPERAPVRREALVQELGDVLYYLTRLGQHFGLGLDDMAAANLRKLRERYLPG